MHLYRVQERASTKQQLDNDPDPDEPAECAHRAHAVDSEAFQAEKAPEPVVRARAASQQVCGKFQLDVSGAFGTCICGFKKAEHNPFSKANYVPTGGKGRSSVNTGRSFTPGDTSAPQHRRVKTVPAADGCELAAMMERRGKINSGEMAANAIGEGRPFNPYTEFEEFSRKECKDMIKMFKTYDLSKDGFINLEELKKMMEALGDPQTHTALKAAIGPGASTLLFYIALPRHLTHIYIYSVI